MEYNEDLNFKVHMKSPYYSCGMMLNGEFFILRLEQVKSILSDCFKSLFSCTDLITKDVLLNLLLLEVRYLYHKMNAKLMHLQRNI